MSHTQDSKPLQANVNPHPSKGHYTIDHSNQPFAQYKAYTCLRDLNSQKASPKKKSHSYDKLHIKKKALTKDVFSQTQTQLMGFVPEQHRLISNITQRQFDEKMNYYKRLIKNPLNPYSAYFNKRIFMPQIPQIRYSNKAFSVLMPNLQDKTLIKNHTGLRSAKCIHRIKTIYPNMTGSSFWNPSNRVNTLHSKHHTQKKTIEDLNKNAYLIK